MRALSSKEMWRSRRNCALSLKHHTCSSAGIQLKKPTSYLSLGIGSSGLNLGSHNPPRWPRRISRDGRSDRISTQDCPLIGYFSMYRTSSPLRVRDSISIFLKPEEFRSNGISFTSSALGGLDMISTQLKLLPSQTDALRSGSFIACPGSRQAHLYLLVTELCLRQIRLTCRAIAHRDLPIQTSWKESSLSRVCLHPEG